MEVLGSAKCRIYELNGEYYPANFTLAKRKQPRIDVPYNSNNPMKLKKNDKYWQEKKKSSIMNNKKK